MKTNRASERCDTNRWAMSPRRSFVFRPHPGAAATTTINYVIHWRQRKKCEPFIIYSYEFSNAHPLCRARCSEARRLSVTRHHARMSCARDKWISNNLDSHNRFHKKIIKRKCVIRASTEAWKFILPKGGNDNPQERTSQLITYRILLLSDHKLGWYIARRFINDALYCA